MGHSHPRPETLSRTATAKTLESSRRVVTENDTPAVRRWEEARRVFRTLWTQKLQHCCSYSTVHTNVDTGTLKCWVQRPERTVTCHEIHPQLAPDKMSPSIHIRSTLMQLLTHCENESVDPVRQALLRKSLFFCKSKICGKPKSFYNSLSCLTHFCTLYLIDWLHIASELTSLTVMTLCFEHDLSKTIQPAEVCHGNCDESTSSMSVPWDKRIRPKPVTYSL